jgi:hypothetical protein
MRLPFFAVKSVRVGEWEGGGREEGEGEKERGEGEKERGERGERERGRENKSDRIQLWRPLQ